jgi:hypothetical protein
VHPLNDWNCWNQPQVTLNVEPWNFELPQGFERLERASVLFDARHRFLKLAFQSQKATSKLLNDAFDATLVC